MCGLETIEVWAVAVRFVCARRDPRRPLVAAIVRWALRRTASFNARHTVDAADADAAGMAASSAQPLEWASSLNMIKALKLSAAVLIELGPKLAWFHPPTESSSNIDASKSALQSAWWHAVAMAARAPTPDVRRVVSMLIAIAAQQTPRPLLGGDSDHIQTLHHSGEHSIEVGLQSLHLAGQSRSNGFVPLLPFVVARVDALVAALAAPAALARVM